MTLDQKIQLGIAIGTWLAGLATFLAVLVSLYLSRQGQKIRLKVNVGLREIIAGDGSEPEEHLGIEVTNVGDRPITVNSIGWAVGKGKHRHYGVQTLSGRYTNQYPIELSYGKSARFMVSFQLTPNWCHDFAEDFIKDRSDRNLKTLVALIHTSIGQMIEVKPEHQLLDRLKTS